MGKNTIREIYKLKSVARWAKKSSFSDENLLSAIDELEVGLVDADYGEGMFKKRVVCDSGQRKICRLEDCSCQERGCGQWSRTIRSLAVVARLLQA